MIVHEYEVFHLFFIFLRSHHRAMQASQSNLFSLKRWVPREQQWEWGTVKDQYRQEKGFTDLR